MRMYHYIYRRKDAIANNWFKSTSLGAAAAASSSSSSSSHVRENQNQTFGSCDKPPRDDSSCYPARVVQQFDCQLLTFGQL
jgi:hypothetical protein